jgi:hypothetical protein
MQAIKLFALLYLISLAFSYYIAGKAKLPKLLPGDLFITKGNNKVYIPFGSALIISFLLFLLLQSII